MAVDLAAIRAARARIGACVARTPLAKSFTLSAMFGADIHLKFENRQFTASFKERGALNRLLLLSPEERRRGVAAMSAGNHAQALAYHGSRLGIPVAIVMPRHTPNAKVAKTRVFGAEVLLHGSVFAETLEFTRELARERDLVLVHPFDDQAVIAGQGTLGLEMVEQLPDVDTVVVPVGGGGLLAGVAVAVRAVRPEARLVGVQAERFRAAVDLFGGREASAPARGTVAEGIAVETPGVLTMPIIRANVDRLVAVSEEAIEKAVFTLLEVEKTVTEGAGAAALAAVATDPNMAKGKTAVVVSGGNIDMMLLSAVLQRGLVRSKRLVRLAVEVPDVPGSMAALTRLLSDLDSNIVDIVHQRSFDASSAKATVIQFVLQMRGEEQVEEVVASLRQAGYEVRM